MKKNKLLLSFLLIIALLSVTAVCGAQNDTGTLIDNGDGTYSMENGIYLRSYEGYSKESQVYLSALDACYSIVSDYSEIIDPYVEGKNKFDSDQWSTIFSEVKYMSGKACSYVMYTETPDDLSEHSYEIFYSAYHLMIANDLLIDAIQNENADEAAIASYYYQLADNTLSWWETEKTEQK